MELKAKNRAYLRSLGVNIKPSVNIGKGEIDNSLINSINCALEAHELIKIKILQNNLDDIQTLISTLEEATSSSFVALTGKTILLYRQRKNNPTIVLPR